jgi:hypothetical protein
MTLAQEKVGYLSLYKVLPCLDIYSLYANDANRFCRLWQRRFTEMLQRACLLRLNSTPTSLITELVMDYDSCYCNGDSVCKIICYFRQTS